MTNTQERNVMNTQNIIDKLEKKIPLDSEGEDRRAAYCVISGFRDGKNAKDISAYYSVDINLVNKWIEYFEINNLTTSNSSQKRGRKGKDLTGFIKSNIGRTVTPKAVAEELGISLPTFYNFYNANRGFFKKVKRGEFEIINPDVIRNTGE